MPARCRAPMPWGEAVRQGPRDAQTPQITPPLLQIPTNCWPSPWPRAIKAHKGPRGGLRRPEGPKASSGDKNRPGAITKRGDRYLRTLLVHGARTSLRVVDQRTDAKSLWARQLKERRHVNRGRGARRQACAYCLGDAGPGD